MLIERTCKRESNSSAIAGAWPRRCGPGPVIRSGSHFLAEMNRKKKREKQKEKQ